MRNKLLWISMVDQAVVVCPSMLVLVPCTRSSGVPWHQEEFPTISTRLVSNWGCDLTVCQKMALQLLRTVGVISVFSPNFGGCCFITLYCCWFGPCTGGGMEVCHCGNPRMLFLSQNCSHFLLFDFLFYYSVCTHSSPLSPAWKTTHLESKHDLNSCATLDIYLSPLSLFSSFHTIGMMI